MLGAVAGGERGDGKFANCLCFISFSCLLTLCEEETPKPTVVVVVGVVRLASQWPGLILVLGAQHNLTGRSGATFPRMAEFLSDRVSSSVDVGADD